MTQALNLALLGNKVNASGQVSLTAGVSGTLPVANGGTGSTTLTANNVLLGNGTSALLKVAPGTSGNVLTSNGSTWTSAAPPAVAPTTAQVLSATAGAAVGAVGSYAFLFRNGTGSNPGTLAPGGTDAGSNLRYVSALFQDFATTPIPAGTWRCMGKAGPFIYSPGNYQADVYGRYPTLYLRIS